MAEFGEAVVVSEAILRARWIEAEVIHLKKMGISLRGNSGTDYQGRARPDTSDSGGS